MADTAMQAGPGRGGPQEESLEPGQDQPTRDPVPNGTREEPAGSDRPGDGARIGFVELDPEPLLPPLWGQSPSEHEEEVQEYRETLARDRAVGKEKLATFAADRQAKSAELVDLERRLSQAVSSASAAALARIGSAESSGLAALRAAVSGARAQIRAQAQAARTQVESGYAAAVAAMAAAANSARTGMVDNRRVADGAVTSRQNEQLTALGDLYDRTEQRMRAAANHAGDLAMAQANRRAEQYRAGMIHRDDNFLDGPLTDNRCKAQADAAIAVGEAYRAELPKAVDEPISDMRNGRPDAEKSIRTIAADVRESLDTILAQSRTNLTDAHNQSLDGANDARQAALHGISQALAAAEARLTQLQDSQSRAIRAQAAEFRHGVQRSAAHATTAISRGAAAARGAVDRGVQEFLHVLAQDEVPHPEQLDDVLRQTGQQLDDRLTEAVQGLRGQADQVVASLGTMAQHAEQGVLATASVASESAGQLAASTGQALNRTAGQTVNGLRELQQGHAEVMRTMQAGHAEANQQVLQGLDAAYVDLAGRFREGAKRQVKAVTEGLTRAATQDIHQKIDEEAKKAYDQVKPRWQAVLAVVIVIVVVVALSIVLGPLVIGAVTAGAAALGAGAAAATIGVIVGGAIVGAVAGAVGQVVSNALNGQPLLDGVLKAAAFGAIGGMIGGGATAAVARTTLSTGARVAIEMGVEVVTDIGLGAADAAISGQAFTWEDALLGVVTTVAVSGVMAHPRVEAMTQRVQVRVEAGLNRIGLTVPSVGGTVDAPSAPEVGRVDAPTVGAPNVPRLDGPTGATGGGSAGPQPGRGPDGATSWSVSDIDPTGGAGSVDAPVRPRDFDAMAAELRRALGSLADKVEVRVDPSLSGRTVRVHYDLGEDGLISNVRMVAGPSATPTDIRLHAPTARTMLRYQGLSGRVRQLLRQLAEWIGLHGSPPVGSRAWEARLELEKLPAIIADRVREYVDADPAARAELEAELDALVRQVELHAETLREWNLDPGRGYVAAESAGQMEARRLGYRDEDLPAGHIWRKYPDRPLELVQIDPDTRKHWFIPPSDEFPRGRIVDERPETAPTPKRRFDANADPSITREQAFDELGGNDPDSPFGKFISVLKAEGIIRTEDDFIARMPDPAGSLYDDVRHKAKAEFMQQLVDRVTTHADLLRVSSGLHSADRGSLGEAWYQKVHARQGASQVTIRRNEIDGVELSRDRRLDLVEDGTIEEIKNIVEYDAGIADQLADLVRLVGHEIPVNGENHLIEMVRVSFLNPDGVINNASWLHNFLELNQDKNLVIRVFNRLGQSREFTPQERHYFDKDSPHRRELEAWLNGTTVTEGGQ